MTYSRYIDPPEAEAMWCGVCQCDAEECKQPEDVQDDASDDVLGGHVRRWVSYRERVRYEYDED